MISSSLPNPFFLISICREEGKQPGAPPPPHFGSTPGYMHTHERIKSYLKGALLEHKRAKKRILQREVVTMRIEFVLLNIGKSVYKLEMQSIFIVGGTNF